MNEEVILIDNKNPNLAERLFIIRRLKNFNRSVCTNYGFRHDKNGFYFYIYSNDKTVIAETIIRCVDKRTKKIFFKPVIIAEAKLVFLKREKRLHIAQINTEDAYKNRGIGSVMLEYIQTLAYKQKAKCVTLDCLQTFIHGKKSFVLRDDNLKNFRDFIKYNPQSKDKNKCFYLKNGFSVANDLEPLYDYLIPMRLNNPKPILKNKVPYKKFLDLKSKFCNESRRSDLFYARKRSQFTCHGTLPNNYVCKELRQEKQKLI